MEESCWYVIQVVSGRERRIKKMIEDGAASRGFAQLIEEVLLPSENVAEMKEGEQKISEKQLWPGYMLIKMQMNPDLWGYIRQTTGVICFLGGSKEEEGVPLPLTDAEVNEIVSDLAERKGEVVQKHQLEVGSRVKIVDGPFFNFEGSVVEVNYEKGVLSVIVSIFGRETRVEDLEFWQIEEITDSASS